MSNYQAYWSEVAGTIPGLSPFLAQTYVNRAWRDIRESRFWSFNVQVGALYAPGSITSGSATITQFSPTVTLDAPATAALTGLVNPPITNRQIRFGSSGEIYNIVSLVGTTLTLDRVCVDFSLSGISYSCYRAYYGPPEEPPGTPVTDFLRYLSVVDPITPLKIRLNFAREDFDNSDPQRLTFDNPAYMGAYRGDSTGLPVYELYPHPVSARPFICQYMKRGIDMSNPTDTVPVAIPENALISRALYYGYTWAMANQGVHTELKGVNWMQLRREVETTYVAELEKAKKQDNDTMLMNQIFDEQDIDFTANSTYQQSHAV